MRRVQLLPLLTPVALALAAVIGDDGVALAPISPAPLHAALAVSPAPLWPGSSTCLVLLQRRMMEQVQALVPKI